VAAPMQVGRVLQSKGLGASEVDGRLWSTSIINHFNTVSVTRVVIGFLRSCFGASCG
jgi:hypothetical protein